MEDQHATLMIQNAQITALWQLVEALYRHTACAPPGDVELRTACADLAEKALSDALIFFSEKDKPMAARLQAKIDEMKARRGARPV